MAEREKPVSSQEVADYLGVARSTIEEWRQKGKGPPFMRIGNRCLYMMSDVQLWLLEQRQDPSDGMIPTRHRDGTPKKPWDWGKE